MRLAFWVSVAIVVYGYLGYAAWLFFCSRWFPRPVRRSPFSPFVTVVMVVRNEAGVLDRKLQNLMQLQYPADRLEIVIVSDGSTDDTNSILQRSTGPFPMHVLLSPHPRGKASGINDGVKIARGEIVLFTDGRQIIDPSAVRLLMENFADPTVGCVSGQLMLGDPASGETKRGMGMYWKIEKHIREMESLSGSAIGATGALYAVRRHLIAALPDETILDDVYVPMHVLRQSARVTFDARALAWDVPDLGRKREFARKVRTLSGNYQLVRLAPWLLSRQNPVWLNFVCHKLVRLITPLALAAAFATSAVIPDPIYRIAFVLQLAFYTLGVCELAQPPGGSGARIADAASTFILLNTAAAVALANFVAGRKTVWVP